MSGQNEGRATPASNALIAGFGFRAQATVASLRSALQAAYTGPLTELSALATAKDKANHPALIGLAHELALPLIAVPLGHLAGSRASHSTSGHIPKRYGAQSLAESTALAAAGSGAHLLAPRAVSADQMATAAIAVTTSNAISVDIHPLTISP